VFIRGSFVVQDHPLRFIRSHCPRCTNSRLLVFICGSKPPAAKPLQDRSRAGKPDLHKFVSIRVHSWFKTTTLRFTRSHCPAARIRGYSCPFVVQNHPLRLTRSHCPRCMNSRLFVSIRGSKPPAAKPLQDRSRAGKPDLHKFVFIRVHSWFKTTHCVSPAATPALHEFVVIRVHSWFKTTPSVSPAATAALDAVTSSEVQPDATTD
jgi:ribosomal protein S27AE